MTLFGLPALQASAALLLCLVVVLVLTGRLVTRQMLEDLRKDRDAQVAALQKQADTWRHAYELAMAAQSQANSHVGELMEAARTTTHVLSSLPTMTQSEVSPHATHAA